MVAWFKVENSAKTIVSTIIAARKKQSLAEHA